MKRKVEQVHYRGAVDARRGEVNVTRTENEIELRIRQSGGVHHSAWVALEPGEAREVAEMLTTAADAGQGPLSAEEERQLERLIAKAEGREDEGDSCATTSAARSRRI
jgi:hypothetical protein